MHLFLLFWFFIAAHRLPLAVEWGCSLLWCVGFIVVAFLVGTRALGHVGLLVVAWGSVVAGGQTWLHHGMWNLPRSGWNPCPL